MEVKSFLSSGLQTCFRNLWDDKYFCDFTVVVDDTSFQCHRVVLCACFGFFQGLFRSQMKECQENRVKICGMTASTFDVIINSVYRGVDGLTLDNVLDVWSATEQLQIRYLTEACEDFAIENVSLNNCFNILRHAKINSAGKVETRILDFVSKNLEKVRNMEHFLELPFDSFYSVIESDYLRSSSEDVVVEDVLKWVDYTHYDSSNTTRSCAELEDSNHLNVDYTNGNNEELAEDISNNKKPDEAISNNDELVDSLKLFHEVEINTVFDVNNGKTKVNLGVNASIENSDNETNITKAASTNSVDETSHTKVESINIVCTGESQKGINGEQSTLSDTKICQTDSLSECVKNLEKSYSARDIPGRGKQVCQNDNNLAEVQSEKEHRKQHLFKLLSVCRLCLISTQSLVNLIRVAVLFSCKESYNLVTEALEYKLCVGRRNGPWPEAAVHREASDMKHAMVFLSDGKFMAHNLSTGFVKDYAALPSDFRYYGAITVFDNVMHLFYVNNDNNLTLNMFTREKSWVKVNSMEPYSYATSKLLAHGNNILLIMITRIYSCNCLYGHSRKWIQCCTLNKAVNFVVAFHQYILMFYTEGNATYALCYNTETSITHTSPTSMSGTSEGMTSFSHLGDVFLLQRDGSLWKICSTVTVPVDIKLITKLWNTDFYLTGSVVYRRELFVFYNGVQQSSIETNLGSVRDLFRNIQIVGVNSDSQCLPMVLPESWFIQ